MIELHPIRKSDCAKYSIVFFHHAGGQSAFFYRWKECFPSKFDLYAVQLNARQQLLDNPREHCFHETVETVSYQLSRVIDHELILFGHSLGGLLAFSTACYLEKSGWRGLKSLFISGINAPSRFRYKNLRSCSEGEALEEILSFGGVPEEILTDRELANYFLPIIRADLLLLDDFVNMRVAKQKVNVPITVFLGKEDKAVDMERALEWKKNTHTDFSLEPFAGGHFYLKDEYPGICSIIRRSVSCPELCLKPCE